MIRSEILRIAKPILFNTEMVRAILDGRKTVTRRVIKPQPGTNAKLISDNLLPETVEAGVGTVYAWEDGIANTPPYKPDDYLYVRETHRVWWKPTGEKTYIYKASSAFQNTIPTGSDIDDFEKIRWEPGIHMPKEAARIFLLVTGVRVERLQDIKGFRAEGIRTSDSCDMCYTINHGCFEERSACGCDNEAETFAEIWDSTIPPKDCDKYGWTANPWCWVIEFERVEVE